jgi:competence protein ComEC
VNPRFLAPFLAGFVFACAAAVRAGSVDGRLDIYWCDSEGGGSTLIATPSGETVLVDSGNPGGRDAGRILHVLTNTIGSPRLDHLIVTHFHIDHFGGAAEIAGAVPLGHLWDNGLPDADPDGNKPSTWPLTSRPYRALKARERHTVKPGTVVPLKAGATPLTLRCLITRQEPAPADGSRPPLQAAPELRDPDSSDNANSSAWLLSFGEFRFFDAGDLTWNTEARLVWPEVRVPAVDVYQVTHHGLHVSNHPDLVRALSPVVSVMNNGPTKGTAGEVLATLRAQPSIRAQYQLHKNARPDGATNNCPDERIANLKPGGANVIVCSVAPDGRRYEIRIPARGYVARYEVRR